MELKIDIDNRDFGKWLVDFEYAYALIYSKRDIQITFGDVFRTRHGYHIYMKYNSMAKKSDAQFRNLLECLLFSDVKKQLFMYLEGNDILFRKKNKISEQHEAFLASKLNAVILKVNRSRMIFEKHVINIETKDHDDR